jgi:hypothetical protein
VGTVGAIGGAIILGGLWAGNQPDWRQGGPAEAAEFRPGAYRAITLGAGVLHRLSPYQASNSNDSLQKQNLLVAVME